MTETQSLSSSLPMRELNAPESLAGKRICLGVTGSIAAYKAPILARLLVKAGAEVQVILTRSAKQFVGPATFAGLTGNACLDDMFDPSIGGELHVELSHDSDLLVVMPATADCLARFAGGRADDLLSATWLSSRCPVLLAPAMHPNMWAHEATQRNVELLRQDPRVSFVGPEHGEVASGERGLGRMAEPESIFAEIESAFAERDLIGQHLVISAGPTVEDLDPVRFISNRSTGKMGFALAEQAARRGARVTLISGPVALPTPRGVERVDVRSAEAMRAAIWRALGGSYAATLPPAQGQPSSNRGEAEPNQGTPEEALASALIMCAAVGDYRPAETHQTKLKRSAPNIELSLVQNTDIIAEIGGARRGASPVLVAFAVETAEPGQLLENARHKLSKKRVDLVVANHAKDSFGRDDNLASLVSKDAVQELGKLPKPALANHILSWVAQRVDSKA